MILTLINKLERIRENIRIKKQMDLIKKNIRTKLRTKFRRRHY